MQKALETYREAQVKTSDNLDLVVLLYEEGARYLKEAAQAYREKDFERKAQRLIYGMEVISELLVSLDLEKGGEIAKRLQALYSFMLRELLLADAREDPEAIERVAEMLEDLKGSWAELKRKAQVG